MATHFYYFLVRNGSNVEGNLLSCNKYWPELGNTGDEVVLFGFISSLRGAYLCRLMPLWSSFLISVNNF